MRLKHKRPPFLIGVDFSMNSPGACTGFEEPRAFHIKHKPGTYPNRVFRWENLCEDFLSRIIPENVTPKEIYLMMEDYAAGAQGRTNEIAELTGILKHKLFFKIGVPPSHFYTISVQHVKMFALSKGNASKDLILKQVYKVWGFDTESDDEADAYIIWRVLYSMLHPASVRSAHQADILSRIILYNKKNNK